MRRMLQLSPLYRGGNAGLQAPSDSRLRSLVGSRAGVEARKPVPELQNAGDAGDPGSIPGPEDPLEKETPHASILAWWIP